MRILAIGAHPDDIEFGCGGTLLKYARKKHDIFLQIMTRGGIGGSRSVRKAEQERAAKFLRAKKIFWGRFKDTRIPISKELIDEVEKVIYEVKPDIIFHNYFNDVHQDHRAIAYGTSSASRYVKRVLYYEVPTTNSFEPDIYVDISDVIKRKLELIKLHTSQVRRTHVPRLTILESVQSCATFRGFQARVKYAEGFKSMRFLMDIS
ncbi:MAG: PIG-L family deacetylase [Candidatus Omnitrophota bacterium]